MGDMVWGIRGLGKMSRPDSVCDLRVVSCLVIQSSNRYLPIARVSTTEEPSWYTTSYELQRTKLFIWMR